MIKNHYDTPYNIKRLLQLQLEYDLNYNKETCRELKRYATACKLDAIHACEVESILSDIFENYDHYLQVESFARVITVGYYSEDTIDAVYDYLNDMQTHIEALVNDKHLLTKEESQAIYDKIDFTYTDKRVDYLKARPVVGRARFVVHTINKAVKLLETLSRKSIEGIFVENETHYSFISYQNDLFFDDAVISDFMVIAAGIEGCYNILKTHDYEKECKVRLINPY